jgi:hypothetical protein
MVIWCVSTPCVVLALALIAMRINFVVFAAFMFPLGFFGAVLIGFVRTMFRK